jgi:hypothetical protein
VGKACWTAGKDRQLREMLKGGVLLAGGAESFARVWMLCCRKMALMVLCERGGGEGERKRASESFVASRPLAQKRALLRFGEANRCRHRATLLP